MKKKIQKQFIDLGCGFPVLLLNVPMVKIEDKWIPDINYNQLEKAILLMLCHKPFKLTGNEIRFARLYFEMTLQLFAKRFGVRHPTVIKWENFKDTSTNMTLGTEKDIRMFIMGQLSDHNKIGELYHEFETSPFGPQPSSEPIRLDIDKLAC